MRESTPETEEVIGRNTRAAEDTETTETLSREEGVWKRKPFSAPEGTPTKEAK